MPDEQHYDIKAYITKTLENTRSTDYRDQATEMIEMIPEQHWKYAMVELAIPHFRIANNQRRAFNPILNAQSEDPKVQRRGSTRPWNDALKDLVHVGGGEYRQLGHCNRADLTFAAQERFNLAESNRLVGLRYVALAEALRNAGVETVGELDPEIFGSL